MKKILIAFIALIGLNVSGMAQTITAPAKMADPIKPAVAPVKVVSIPKTFSKVTPKDKTPILAKTPATENSKVATPATLGALKKDSTPANHVKKDGQLDMRYKKGKE
jgi:hypothetical protein